MLENALNQEVVLRHKVSVDVYNDATYDSITILCKINYAPGTSMYKYDSTATSVIDIITKYPIQVRDEVEVLDTVWNIVSVVPVTNITGSILYYAGKLVR